MLEVFGKRTAIEPPERGSRSPALRRVLSPTRLARMSGSSIAAPRASAWVTDFLNAAYYRRPSNLRRVDDLRLAFAILTTRWHRGGARRFGAHDIWGFHRAFGRDRFLDAAHSVRGSLSREQLLEGASRLLGPWFPEAYGDEARRGWGLVFETAEERESYLPETRLRRAALGALAPPAALEREQTWCAYPPVPVRSAQDAVASLCRTETWPDYASELGRFTPLRSCGLLGQTFEIEVVAHPTTRTPVFTRGYVTVTRLASAEDPGELDACVAELNASLARSGGDGSPAVPHGATPILAFDLTTHEGHFIGRGRNRLLLFEEDGQAYLRTVGAWDPMEWPVRWTYRRTGRRAQRAFWGAGAPEESMFHQMASVHPGGHDGLMHKDGEL